MAEGPPDFTSALQKAVRVRDLLLLAVPPAVLLAVFSLPLETREAYTFSYTHPDLVTAFAANFVHLSRVHLLGSLAAYLLLVGVGYTLAVLASHRRLFGVTMVVYLLGLPPVLSVLNLAAPRDAVTYGFSGINMALAGLLAPLLVTYAGQWLYPELTVRDSPPLFFVGMAVVALFGVPASALTVGVAVASVGAALLYRFPSPRRLKSTYRWLRRPGSPVRQSGWFELIVIGLLIYGGFLLVGFPANPRSGQTVVNSYVHLVGFALGYLVPYIALELGLFEPTPP